MKILYIGHFKEASGYGRSCRDYLFALKETGYNISSVSINLGKSTDFYDETEKNSIKNPDIVINHTLPHFIEYGPRKNIAISILESDGIHYTPWHQHLDICNEVWYPHPELRIFNTERFIPQPVDVSIYEKEYKTPQNICPNGVYKFYFIGELIKRKNISGLLTSYFTEFTDNDPVLLILKINHSTKSQEEIFKEVDDLSVRIKNGLRKKSYPNFIILSENISDEMVYGLHQYCNCFVSATHGESICYPMLDAIGFGNNVVVNEFPLTGLLDDKSVSKSPCKEPCFAQFETFNFYNTGLESWNSLNIIEFGKKMRKAMDFNQNNNRCIFSYQDIAQKIRESTWE